MECCIWNIAKKKPKEPIEDYCETSSTLPKTKLNPGLLIAVNFNALMSWMEIDINLLSMKDLTNKENEELRLLFKK